MISWSLTGLASFGALERALESVAAPAQLAKEAQAAAPVVKILYLNGYTLQRSPSGAGWAARKGSYPHPPLQKTKAMRDDTTVTAEGGTIVVRVPALYAKHQHGGTATIDARPLVPVSTLGTWEQPIGLARRAVGYNLP